MDSLVRVSRRVRVGGGVRAGPVPLLRPWPSLHAHPGPRPPARPPPAFPTHNFTPFSPPCQGAFHPSLAVLLRYRSPALILPWMPCTTPFGLHSQAVRLARDGRARVCRANGAVTLCGAAFQRTCRATHAAARPGHTGARCARAFGPSTSRFTRRYCGNPCWFLFLCLLICLSSAGSRAWCGVVLCCVVVCVVQLLLHSVHAAPPPPPLCTRPVPRIRPHTHPGMATSGRHLRSKTQ